ncbi:TPA: helix-turn-helix domain-containing protein [Salmonella enterica subsp. enterica serovar 6,14:y:1,7]|nr:helix-turn-helix domain-containing protein [Salmonella enterica subsp. enterica serovar 6,14:y:1,7]
MSNALLNAIKQIETLQIEALESCSNSAKKVLLEIAIEKTQVLKEIISNQPLFSTCDDGALIGERIRIARKKLGMSLDDLAAAVIPGDVEVLLEWENNKSEPCASEIIRLSQALKCDPMWLLTGEGNNANQAAPVNVMKGADLANIGVRIKNRRNETGMGADKLADAIDVPIHQIYQWEEGKVIPHSGYYCRLAKALNTSMSWLMTGKDISGEFKNQHDENIPSSDLTNL